MSTFVSTVLTKRSGTTTTFEPSGIDGGFAYLRASGASALNGPSIRAQQQVTERYRRASVRLLIPEVDSNGLLLRKPSIDMALYVPQGASATDVDDIVGYLNALTATSLTNFDSFFVDGVGMF